MRISIFTPLISKIDYMINRILCFFVACFLIQSCVPGFDKDFEGVDMDLSQSEYQAAFKLQDEQKIDSLYALLQSDNPTLAYIAAQAFASIQEKKTIDSVAAQLNNIYPGVRGMSAFALGQIGSESAEDYLIEAFKNKDTLDTDNIVNSRILEAVGKCGGENMLKALSTISTYRNTDTLLLLGQVRGIYRYGLRGMTIPAGTKRMVDIVTDNTFPSEVRLMAAHYLARVKDIDINDYKFRLVKFFTADPDPNIRMAIAKAMSKVPDGEIHSYLLNQLTIEGDYRVMINILRSLESFPYIKSIEPVIKLLSHKNIHVAEAAAQFLVASGNGSDASFYRTLISDSLHYSVNNKLYEAVLKNIPFYFTNTRKKIKEEILAKAKDSISIAEKVGLIRALSHEPRAYTELKEFAFESKDKAVSTTCIEAIHGLLVSPHFIKTHKGKHLFKRKEIADILIDVFKKGDSGMSAVAADMIIDPETKLKDIITEVSYLIEARNNLSLPREIETYNKIQEAISLLKGEEFNAKKVTFNNPIDWSRLEGISDTTMFVIQTNKGSISLKPFANAAPGTVANFIKLAEADFYDNKIFHRVVPNFVIQGGCPRGDGYGSLDYTIRSEFAPLYYNDEGYIGMASAGPHTEGTQFFITHSPTPHLDGRYTIFGKVTDGMDVVHDIFPGDNITNVIIKK